MNTCSTCRFWDHINKDVSDGICRRRSPVPLIAEKKKSEGDFRLAMWPSTFAQDWCGEHEPQQEQP